MIRELIVAATLSAKAGDALRQWTGNSISQTTPKERQKTLNAVAYLATIKGQKFPAVAYRVLSVNPNKLRSWDEFRKWIKDTNLPEAYSSDLAGVKSFIKNGGGSGAVLGTNMIVFEVTVASSDWMFNVNHLTSQLATEEQNKKDRAGFSLREQLSAKEIVARSGSFKRALGQKKVKIIGAENTVNHEIRWYPAAKEIGAVT